MGCFFFVDSSMGKFPLVLGLPLYHWIAGSGMWREPIIAWFKPVSLLNNTGKPT